MTPLTPWYKTCLDLYLVSCQLWLVESGGNCKNTFGEKIFHSKSYEAASESDWLIWIRGLIRKKGPLYKKQSIWLCLRSYNWGRWQFLSLLELPLIGMFSDPVDVQPVHVDVWHHCLPILLLHLGCPYPTCYWVAPKVGLVLLHNSLST